MKWFIIVMLAFITAAILFLVIQGKLEKGFLGAAGGTGVIATLATARTVRTKTAIQKAKNKGEEAAAAVRAQREAMTDEEKAADTGDERDARHAANRAGGRKAIDDIFVSKRSGDRK